MPTIVTERARMGHDVHGTGILELIDRLETHVTSGKRFKLGSRAVVDEGEFLEILDMMRSAVPAEIQLARRIIQERQKLILDAQSEAEKIVVTARERAEYLISEMGLTAEARYRSEEQLRKGKEQSDLAKQEIDRYCSRRLDDVERIMRQNLAELEAVVQQKLDEIEHAKLQLAGAH